MTPRATSSSSTTWSTSGTPAATTPSSIPKVLDSNAPDIRHGYRTDHPGGGVPIRFPPPLDPQTPRHAGAFFVAVLPAQRKAAGAKPQLAGPPALALQHARRQSHRSAQRGGTASADRPRAPD